MTYRMTEREWEKYRRERDDVGHTDMTNAGVRAPELEPAPASMQTLAPVPTEHEEQCALITWAELNAARLPGLYMLAAVPNGGYRDKVTAKRMKAEGLKAGYPDLLLDVPCGGYHGLRIEMKRSDRSNHPTPEQGLWIERLRQYGYKVVVCYGVDEAIKAIESYLQGKDRR